MAAMMLAVLFVFAIRFISIVNGACQASPDFADPDLANQKSIAENWLSSLIIDECNIQSVEDQIVLSVYKNGESKPRFFNLNDVNSIKQNFDLNAPISNIIPDYATEVHTASGTIHKWAITVGKNYKSNVIIHDWSKLAFKNYACVVKNIVPKIADAVAKVINTLRKKYGIKRNKFVIGGLGVGAHIGGLASERLPQKLHVCLGFDPAGPLYNGHAAQKLKPNSCEIVYVVYTNAILFGIGQRCGTVNIYVNGAYVQPGCDFFKAPLCSHWRATFLDIARWENPNKFFVRRKKEKYPFMDYENTPCGDYSLETGKYWPYLP